MCQAEIPSDEQVARASCRRAPGHCFRATLFIAALIVSTAHAAEQPLLPVGAARVDVTPEYPVRLSGFGFRRTESEGVTQPIWAKALAIGDDKAGPLIMIAVDNVGIPAAMVEEVAERLGKNAPMARPRLAVTASHTHTAPMLRGVLANLFGQPIPPEHQAHIDRYTAELTDKLVQVAEAALADRQPAHLAWTVGAVKFAKNRRTAGGPVDHDLPMLVARSAEGKLRGVWVSYACHCVTLSNNKLSGDWAGYAQQIIEREHPGCVALVSIGCGADQNPTSGVTGDKTDVAQTQGGEIAAEVNRLLKTDLKPLGGPLAAQRKQIELAFDAPPARAKWEELAKQSNPTGYHARVQLDRLDRGEKLQEKITYPVESWTFGDDLAIVFLPGEVVVDYSLRLKNELDRSRLWINSYANDAPCYIPSERVLKEGGYEGAVAMIYYDRPTRFKPGLEQQIVDAVTEQIGQRFGKVDAKGKRAETQPLAPEESLAAIRPKPGMTVELVVAEPLIADPVAIDFGPDGRLWVAEMYDYPSGLDGDYQPGGRVRLVTDADGDGRYDASTVFLDGIPFPTGVTAWRGGVLVCAAPDILYAEDTDGDGRADVRRVLFTGFGTGNYQARVNSLEYGLDNWVYGSCGLFGGDIKSFACEEPFHLGDRDFRIRPDSGEIEAATGRTQQGRPRDDWGHWFGCDNSNLARHLVLADHYLRRNPFLAPPASSVNLASYPGGNMLHPISDSVQRFKLSGPSHRVTAACGLGVYRDELLGPEYANNLFTCGPVNLVVHRIRLEPDGVTFQGKLADDETTSEFLASTDTWFRPVQARTGPDGALWIVDMYRYVIEHPRWIPPESLATLDVRAGAGLGRIYRVYDKSRPPRPIARLDRLDAAGLAAALDSPNGPQRDLAQQLLVWNKRREAAPALVKLAGASSRPQTRLQALCALDGLEALDEATLFAARTDEHPQVRSHALRLAEKRHAGSRQAPKQALMAVDDWRPAVSLQLAYSLGAWGDDPAAAAALATLLVKHRDDIYLTAAGLSSINKSNLPGVAESIAAVGGGKTNLLVRKVLDLAVAYADSAALGHLLTTLDPKKHPQTVQRHFAALADLFDSFERHDRLPETLLTDEQLADLAKNIAEARAIFDDDQTHESNRLAALRLLGRQPEARARDIELAAGRLAPQYSAALQAAVLARLARINDPAVPGELLARFNSFSPALRDKALAALMSRPAWLPLLLDGIEAGQIGAAGIDAARRQVLLENRDPTVRERAGKLFAGAATRDRQRVVEEYRQKLVAAGDRQRGKAVFARRCAACHQFDGAGHVVGPDLAAITNKSIDFLLTAVLNPNQAVDGRYQQYQAVTQDGRGFAGILVAETAASVTLREQEGKDRELLRGEIEELAASGKSMMPEGLEKDIMPAEMSDLLAYLGAQ